MSLRNFPPSEMETQLVDDRTPLILSNSVQLQRQKKQLQRRDESSFMPLLCVILAVVFERITYYGTVANLLLFCLNELKTSPSNAIAITFVFPGLAWLMSFIGGLIGDSYSGRYNAIWGSLNIYMYGSFMLLVVAYVVEEKEKVKGIRIVPMALIALLAISVGEGAFKANLTAFGADQLQGQDETRYRRFFNWYYWSINIGSFTAFSAIAYFEQVLCFTRAFAILWCCIIASAVFFCSSRSRYICCPPSGNIFKKVYNIIKEARRKHKEVSSSNQHCPGLEDYMPVRSWLDHAMMKYGGSYLDSDVEEVKTIGKILIIFAVLVPYWTIYSQMNSTFLLQGLHMRVSLDRNNTLNNFANIPPAWLSLVDVIFVLALIPVMDKCVYPWLDRKGWNWSVFTRISIGFLCAVVSMVAAGMVEVKRAGETHDCVNQTIGSKNYAACLPIVLQIPQYGLIGISEVFASVGALEFAYKEAPKCMQSFVMGLFFVVQSLGSLFGAALFELCSVWRWTPSISGESIEPVSKLKGHLSYYFFLLAGITFLTWLVFLVVSFNSPLNQRNQKRAFMARIRPWQDGQ